VWNKQPRYDHRLAQHERSYITPISPAQAKLVLDVTRMLAVTTDLDTLLMYIAQAACGLLDCERASVFQFDPNTNQLYSRVALQTNEIRVPSSAGIVGAAFTSNEVLVVPDPYHDPRFNRDVDKKTGFVTRNLLTAPMANLDRKAARASSRRSTSGPARSPIPTSRWCRCWPTRRASRLQRYHLQQTAMKAEAMRHEMKLARRVQDAMLPKEIPNIRGSRRWVGPRPASVTGGDCFDLWRTHDGRLAIFLADASGHGLAPTLVVSQVRTLIRAFAEVDPNPRRLLERANSRLSADLEAERFCTAFLAILDADGTMVWCSAGHGPILFRPSGTSKVEELVPNELPLGVMPDLTGEETTPLKLDPGGLLRSSATESSRR
jgi:phosphoserine phosphatase